MALNAYVGTEERPQMNNLKSYLKNLEKEKQKKPNEARRKKQ